MNLTTDNIEYIIHSYDQLYETNLSKRIGICAGFNGITSQKDCDVILYNKDLIDLFYAIKAICNADLYDINRKLQFHCSELYSYIIKSDMFFPIIAILTPDGIVKDNSSHMDDEYFRTLLLIFGEVLNSLISEIFELRSIGLPFDDKDFNELKQCLEDCNDFIVTYLETIKDQIDDLVDDHIKNSIYATEEVKEND